MFEIYELLIERTDASMDAGNATWSRPTGFSQGLKI